MEILKTWLATDLPAAAMPGGSPKSTGARMTSTITPRCGTPIPLVAHLIDRELGRQRQASS